MKRQIRKSKFEIRNGGAGRFVLSDFALRIRLVFRVSIFGFSTICSAQTVDTHRVAWQHPVMQGADTGAGGLIDDLRHEVQQILDRPPLAPMQLNYGDIEGNGYTIYNEPGRILLTLAWAYPHLSTAQQAAVRAYVTNEVAQTARMPWGGAQPWDNHLIARTNGAPREHHPRDRNWNTVSAFGSKRPTLFSLYGFWLYGHRTGHWSPVTNAYAQLANAYFNRVYQPGQGSLYGTFGAHIGMARLAQRMGDTATRDEAVTNLHAALIAALDFTAIDNLAGATPVDRWNTPYGHDCYDELQVELGGTAYRGWPFLNLTPEAGRFIADRVPAALARHQQGLGLYGFPWISKNSYYIRYFMGGSEGTGLTPEYTGMFAPMERWALGGEPARLSGWVRSGPSGIGDCYWVEALVQAIEANGSTGWSDVRSNAPPFVAVAEPLDGATVTGALLAVLAAYDPDGAITNSVVWYDGSTSAPADPGIYTLQAVAWDNAGASATSLPARVRLVSTNHYAAWAAANIPDPEARWWEDDADGDGTANAAEYALPGDLLIDSFLNWPAAHFAVLPDAAGEFEVNLAVSPDLMNWQTAWSWQAQPPLPTNEWMRAYGSPSHVKVGDNSAADIRFMRLEVRPRP
jgi:hypothetical protein